MSSASETRQYPGMIPNATRDDLIEAADRGTDDLDRTLLKWQRECPGCDSELRNEARTLALLWGLREPERLGPYLVLDIVASEGMGKVYRAREDVTGRIVAVKTIRAGARGQVELAERFDTERRLLSRLHHSNIIPLLATGQEGPLLYLAMPFVPGVTLRALINATTGGDEPAPKHPTFATLFDAAMTAESNRRKGSTRAHSPGPDVPVPAPAKAKASEAPDLDPPPLPPDYLARVATLMESVARAVEHIHEARILHRDLKPSNLMIESTGHAWVIDIGVGREMASGGEAHGDGQADGPCDGMTRGVGTLPYMAPEQLPGHLAGPGAGRQDARTDVWGLGATLYELIALTRPFDAPIALELARKILNDPPAQPRSHVPRELMAVCLKALEKAPEDRYPSAAAFAEDLRRWLAGRPTKAGRAGPLRKAAMWARRRPAAAFAAGMTTAFLILAGLGAAQAYQHDIEREQAETQKVQDRLKAEQREQEVLALSQLRKPIRKQGWFDEYWQRGRSLRGDSTSPDPLIQGQLAGALEGIDARDVKTFHGAFAPALAFDSRSERLLLVRLGRTEEGEDWTQTVLWDRATGQNRVERDLGDGVVAFRKGDTPIQLSWDLNDRAQLLLFQVTPEQEGPEPLVFRSPLEGVSALTAIAIARDGSRIASVACPARLENGKLVEERDGATTIAVWDSGSNQPIHTLDHKETHDIVLSPDGSLLAAWDESGEVTVWTLSDGKPLPPFRVGRCPVATLAFGRDPVWSEAGGNVPPWLLAVAESNGLITVWDLRAQGRRNTCRGSVFGVFGMSFSDDGAFLLSAGRTPTKLWDVATGTCLLDLGVGDYLGTVEFAPDGIHCAFGGRLTNGVSDPTASVIALERGHGIQTFYGLGGVVEWTASSPDGRFIAAATHEWEVGVWERRTDRLVGVFPGPIGDLADSFGLVFDPTSSRLACSAGREARLWDLREVRLIGRWELPAGLCDSIAFLGDDRDNPLANRLRLVRREDTRRVGGKICRARLYELTIDAPAQIIKQFDEFNAVIHRIQIAPDASFFAIEGVAAKQEKEKYERIFQVYEGPTGSLVKRLPTSLEPDKGGWFHFDPTAKVLAAHLGGGMMTIHDLPNVEYRGITRAPVGCLDPGGNRSMAATDEKPPGIALIDLATEQLLMRVAWDTYRLPRPSFTPDGGSALLGRPDGAVSVLDFGEVNKRLTPLRLGW